KTGVTRLHVHLGHSAVGAEGIAAFAVEVDLFGQPGVHARRQTRGVVGRRHQSRPVQVSTRYAGDAGNSVAEHDVLRVGLQQVGGQLPGLVPNGSGRLVDRRTAVLHRPRADRA